jgi:hypothetical protein
MDKDWIIELFYGIFAGVQYFKLATMERWRISKVFKIILILALLRLKSFQVHNRYNYAFLVLCPDLFFLQIKEKNIALMQVYILCDGLGIFFAYFDFDSCILIILLGNYHSIS